MKVIYAEKPDVGTKIAAALDGITLNNGTKVGFNEIQNYERPIKSQRATDGFFKINHEGEETYVTWGYGHLCELMQAQDYNAEYAHWYKLPLPFIPDEYKLKLKPKVSDQFNVIKSLFSKTDYIICATDSDREGDLIFHYVYSYMRCRKPFKRALFDKHSAEEYKRAFASKNLIDGKDRKPVIDAGVARSRGDFVVGANLTVAATLSFRDDWNSNDHKPFSVGRVQTVVLRMLVDRELAIKDFKPEPFYTIKGIFKTSNNETYVGTYDKRFQTKEEAEELLQTLNNGEKAVVTDVVISESTKKKPSLFSLDTLQIAANKAYGFSLDETLKIAQDLYEKGYITYPRTDSMFLPEDMEDEMDDVLDTLEQNPLFESMFSSADKKVMDSKRYFDSSKVSSHYAIVPTTKDYDYDDSAATKLFRLIAMSVITMRYPDAKMLRETIRTTVNNVVFRTSGTSVKNPGYLTVIGIPKDSVLPLVKKGESVDALCEREDKMTSPPLRYTDETILKAMINCGKEIEMDELREVLMRASDDGSALGIGRPSTRAAILSTLEARGYMTRNKKSLVPTDKGIFLIKKLPVDEIKNPVLTAKWEARLDDIANGKDSLSAFMRDIEDTTTKWTNEITATKIGFDNKKGGRNMTPTNVKCPFCGKMMMDAGWGYVCEDEEECGFKTGKEIAHKQCIDEELLTALCFGETSKEIKGFKKRDGGTFSAKLMLDREKKQITFAPFEEKTSSLTCPKCGRPLKLARRGGFYCPGYSDNSCSFFIGKIKNKILSEAACQQLLQGKPIKVENLISKGGGRYNAWIELKKDGSLKFWDFEWIEKVEKKRTKSRK